MKKLLLIRHAKSDWGVNQADFDRPLNERGLENAPKMAERLKDKKVIPDFILFSAALRTSQTAEFFNTLLKVKNQQAEIRIYEAALSDLLSVLTEQNDAYELVAMIGHNPGIAHLIQYLTHQIIEVPTCAMAMIELEINSWAELSAGIGQLKWFDYPKNSATN